MSRLQQLNEERAALEDARHAPGVTYRDNRALASKIADLDWLLSAYPVNSRHR